VLRSLFSPGKALFPLLKRVAGFLFCGMLTTEDFHTENWAHVTWQIISGNYVWGFVRSEVLPPSEYLHWLMHTYNLFDPESVKLISEVQEKDKSSWRIILSSALEKQES
jgi:hypothetical protein